MAHVKAGAATSGNRDSEGKRLGIKVYGGEKVISGNIIVRQKGTKYNAGIGTKLGKDYTIFATREGVVNFKRHWKDTIIEVVTANT
ncbi:50S ribosomal protein L27 [Candidatus Gottesmanbacteria bacterium]|nr:50S ribosomal protein L27 [Candidatus Gottesmanbacteria bacterium]